MKYVSNVTELASLHVGDEDAAGDGRAERPDCHEEPEWQDGEQRVVAEPAMRAACRQLLQECRSRTLHQRRHCRQQACEIHVDSHSQ